MTECEARPTVAKANFGEGGHADEMVYADDLFDALVSSLLFVAASGLGQEVIVYRPKKLAHWALKPSVYVDGRQVARLQDGRYFTIKLRPGHYTFTSTAKAPSLEVDIKSGEHQYLEMIMVPGWPWKGRLVPVSAGDGNVAIQTLRASDRKFVFRQGLQ
jgi:hypothetical protein